MSDPDEDQLGYPATSGQGADQRYRARYGVDESPAQFAQEKAKSIAGSPGTALWNSVRWPERSPRGGAEIGSCWWGARCLLECLGRCRCRRRAQKSRSSSRRGLRRVSGPTIRTWRPWRRADGRCSSFMGRSSPRRSPTGTRTYHWMRPSNRRGCSYRDSHPAAGSRRVPRAIPRDRRRHRCRGCPSDRIVAAVSGQWQPGRSDRFRLGESRQVSSTRRVAITVPFPGRSRLVMFTDGLVERTTGPSTSASTRSSKCSRSCRACSPRLSSPTPS